MTISPNSTTTKAAASLRSRILLTAAGAALLVAAIPAQAATTTTQRSVVDCLEAPIGETCWPNTLAPGASSLTLPGTDTSGVGPTGEAGPPEEDPCTTAYCV